MHRTQVQLDEASYRALRERAFATGCSLAMVVREAVASYLGHGRARRPPVSFFSFRRAGRSRGPMSGRIAVDHDEALAEDFLA